MRALVTGGNRGIGLEVCKRLVAEGHEVLLGSRREFSLPGARTVTLDVASPKSILDCVAGIAELDLLVNNAGVSGTPDVWQVNLRGPLLLLRALGARLRCVVNVSSGMGALASQTAALRERLARASIDDLFALAEEGPGRYGASKAALNAATRLFALELPHARVNAASPGWVRTDMGGPGAPRSVEQGAESVLWACRLPPDGPTGRVFQDGREIGF